MRRRVGAALGIVGACVLVVLIASNRDPGESPAADSPTTASHSSASRPISKTRSPRSRNAGGSAGAPDRAEPPPAEAAPRPPSAEEIALEKERAQTNERVKRVGPRMFEVMDELIREKAREPIVGSPPTAGSLAAARSWCNNDLIKPIWDRVGQDLQLTTDSLSLGWNSREKGDARTASYGAGSSIVANRRRTSASQTAADSRADEQWWAAASEDEKAEFLTALFVETSGYFEVVKITVGPCRVCGGRGPAATDTEGVSPRCSICNDAGGVKSVSYR